MINDSVDSLVTVVVDSVLSTSLHSGERTIGTFLFVILQLLPRCRVHLSTKCIISVLTKVPFNSGRLVHGYKNEEHEL